MTTIASTSSGTVSFAGLASGIDTASIIESILEVERAPIDTMEDKKEYLSTKLDAYTEFNSLLESFYASLTGLNDANDLNTFAVRNSGSDSFSLSTTSLAEAGSYSVEVVSLAQQQKDVSTNGIADTSTTSLSGSLQIGEATLDYSDVTLSELADLINDGDYGVSASIINDGTDNGYRLKLTVASAGEEVAITGTGSLEFDTATNGHTVAGAKAHLVIDGIDYYSSSNTVTDAIKGVTITLLEANEGTTSTVTIESDAETVISDQLQEMVEAYNAIDTYIDTISGSDSTLANTMKSVQRSLRNYLTSKDLTTIGISTNWETGELEFDTEVFSEAYAKDADSIKTALVGDEDNEGLMNRLDDYLTEQLNSSTGFLVSKETTINKQISDLEDRISAMETRLEKRQATLEAQYAAMEELISTLTSQGDYITSFFESYNQSS
ncbi:flagellar filament capping protein FliD [Desulfobulbus elongatus]|uniref:flagellar filament capping protein FliD n=1 Tax=Desulfobulbus elongatus TaxID=53332 RepID=UPI0004882016|nr:flagellar filament capping protein FliD [Desulfobulbus elongatus]